MVGLYNEASFEGHVDFSVLVLLREDNGEGEKALLLSKVLATESACIGY